MRNIKNEQGNILVSTVLILVVMSLLGTGLMKTSARDMVVAAFKTIESTVFHITESCSEEVVDWFEVQKGTPSSVPNMSQSNLDFLLTGTETTEEANKLAGYSYSCTTTYITSQTETSNTTSGGEIGNSGGEYGGSGTTALKDYYQIVAIGAGPKNSSKTINTIVSVEY